MFKYLHILLTALITMTTAYGSSWDSARTGDKSLMFSFKEGSIHPQSFDGGIGFGFFISPGIQLRIPLNFKYSSNIEEKPVNTETDKTESTMGAGFNPAIRFNIGQGSSIVAYTGAGLIFGYNNSKTIGIDFKKNRNEKNEFVYGLTAFVGTEWLPWPSFGLALEYHPALTFTSGNKLYESSGFTQEDKLPVKTNFNLAGSSILLVLSFYFN